MTSLRLQIWDLRELWQWIINECVCLPPRRGDPDDQLVSQLHFRRQTWGLSTPSSCSVLQARPNEPLSAAFAMTSISPGLVSVAGTPLL